MMFMWHNSVLFVAQYVAHVYTKSDRQLLSAAALTHYFRTLWCVTLEKPIPTTANVF